MYPQKLVNVRLPVGFDWRTAPGILNAANMAEAKLNGNGRVLLRPSGTEPLLRIMVEGRDANDVLRHAEAIANAARSAIQK